MPPISHPNHVTVLLVKEPLSPPPSFGVVVANLFRPVPCPVLSVSPCVPLGVQEWNRMSEEEKEPYKTKANDDTMRYREAMTVWKDGGAGVCVEVLRTYFRRALTG